MPRPPIVPAGSAIIATPGKDGSNVLPTDTAIAAAIGDGDSQTAAALSAAYAAKRLLPAPVTRCWGHSYMHGSSTSTGGAVIGTSDMATLIAADLDLPLDNEAVSGASLFASNSGADWSEIMQYEVRPTKFAAVGGAYALMYGLNDAVQLGHTEASLVPFQHALRAVIARLRCAAILEDTDPSLSYGGSGTWVTAFNTAFNSGNSYTYNVTSGATFTITTPASFPGGTIDIGLVAWGDAGGGTVTGPSSLGSPTLDTTTFAGTDSRHAGVLRVTDVPAGSGSYVFTTSGVSGGAGVIVDWWGWEPPEASCAVVAVIGQPHVMDYSSQTGTGAGPVTDAGVDTLNGIQQSVVAEFGSRCVYVDTSGIDGDTHPSYWEAGNVHPNAAGHAYIASQTVAAIGAVLAADKAQLVPMNLNSATAPGASWTAYTPVLAGNGVTQGNATVSGIYLPKDANGIVRGRAIVTIGSTTVIGTNVTISLPVATATGTQHIRISGSWNNGSGTVKPLFILNNTSTTAFLRDTAGANINATNPVAYASGQIFDIDFEYRAS